MKKLFIIILILSSAGVSPAQVSYPSIRYDYLAYLQSDSDSIQSQANRESYELTVRRSKTKIFIGALSIAAGTGLLIGGVSRISKNFNKFVNNGEESDGSGIGMLMLGTGALVVGIPLTISGSVKLNKANDKLNEMNASQSLSLTLTADGIGLVVNF